MKLSMWLLKDWLKKYNMIPNITNGDMILEGARLFSLENPTSYLPSQIYVGCGDGFIGSMGNQVICVNGSDWIRIKDVDKEQIFNDILQAFEFYNKWEALLESASARKPDVQALLDASQAIFRNPMFILDIYSNVIAMSLVEGKCMDEENWNYMVEHGRLSLDMLCDLKKDPQLLRSMEEDGLPRIVQEETCHHPLMIAGIHAEKARRGFMVVIGQETPFGEHTAQLLEILLFYIKKFLSSHSASGEFTLTSGLFIKLLRGEPLEEKQKSRLLQSMHWDTGARLRLYKIHNPLEEHVSNSILTSRISSHFPSGAAFEYGGDIFFLCNCDLPCAGDLEEELGFFLEKLTFHCGGSLSFQSLDLLHVAARQADLALRYGEQRPGVINRCADHIWKHLCDAYSHSFTALHLCHPGVKALLLYDREHGTEFLDTLYCYLRNERRLTHTAKAMYLHRNTLFYRIERIQQIMGTDLENPTERELALLSLRMLAHTKKTAPEP